MPLGGHGQLLQLQRSLGSSQEGAFQQCVISAKCPSLTLQMGTASLEVVLIVYWLGRSLMGQERKIIMQEGELLQQQHSRGSSPRRSQPNPAGPVMAEVRQAAKCNDPLAGWQHTAPSMQACFTISIKVLQGRGWCRQEELLHQ